MNEELADATVRKYTGYAKHFFAMAVEREHLTVSPFEKLVSGSVGNDERQYEVSRKETERLIDVCPDAEWRLIVALSRYAGSDFRKQPLRRPIRPGVEPTTGTD